MAGRHSREQLAAFLDQELRQVWAADRATGEPVFLAVRQAQVAREIAKQQWRCPVPDCQDDRITTVGTPRRRDHFRHLGASGGHTDGEGVFHLQAKAMLATWLSGRYPQLRVQEEESVKTPVSRAGRRADVMATWAGGERLALEVEYKAFSPEAFNRKDEEYRAVGVRCVWIFGHLRRHLAQPRRPAGTPPEVVDDRLLLRNTTRAAAGAGHVLLFINPVERSIATAVVEGHALHGRPAHWFEGEHLFGLRHPDGTEDQWQEIRLRVDPLDDCEADPQRGLITPAMHAVERSRAEVRHVAAQDRRRLQEQREAADRAEQERQAAQHERERRRERTQLWVEKRRVDQEQAWLGSELRARVLAREGHVPEELAVPLRDSYGVFAHPEHWHCALYGDLVLAGGKGSSFTVGDCYMALSRHGIECNRKDPAKRAKAVIAFLEHLEHCGVLRIQYEADSSWRIQRITVLGDLKAAAHAREQRRQADRRATEARQQARQAQHDLKERRLRRLAEKNRARYGPAPTTSTTPAPPAPDNAEGLCAVCRQPLDRKLLSLRVHPCC